MPEKVAVDCRRFCSSPLFMPYDLATFVREAGFEPQPTATTACEKIKKGRSFLFDTKNVHLDMARHDVTRVVCARILSVSP